MMSSSWAWRIQRTWSINIGRSTIFLRSISYSDLDKDYVNDVLLPGLEKLENPEYKYTKE
jgi:hypothetical protein